MKAAKVVSVFMAALFLCACLGSTPSQSESPPPAAPPGEAIPSRGSENKFVVGISWQGMTSYVRRLEKALFHLVEQADYEIELLIMDAQENSEKQISQVESFIAHKADIIILNPCSYNGLGPAVTAAADAHIPIVTVITRVREQALCTSFVGSDHKESSILEGAMAARYLGGKGDVVILEGTVGIDAQIARNEGYAEMLKDYPDLRVVASQPAFWEGNEAYMIVENWLHNNVEMDAILSQNDNMALGALAAVRDAGMQDEIMVFGIDGDREAVESVRDGGLVGTVFMDAASQAKWILHCISAIRAGEQPSLEYIVPFIVMNRDNINEAFIQRILARESAE